jgi:hypothetical protein
MHFMNPAHGKHMGQKAEPATPKERPALPSKDVNESTGQHMPPHIHIHQGESGKIHVHIMHHDKADDHHEHESSDTEGAAQHIHDHFGGKEGQEGQDHGGSSNDEGLSEEHGFGL